jgi:RNA-directed DNA polymerase
MDLNILKRAYDYPTVALFFGVPPNALKNHLYGTNGYVSFPIAKKSGGIRLISSPVNFRRELQKKLLPLLSEVYRVNSHSHGFIKDRSIKSNASPHTGKQLILNVDLHEFFSSITFKRVRGLFLKPPFSFHWSTANILAQVCCHEGVLPTGGITSPIISNIIMARLDKKMASLITRLGGDYTRYADDLTYSFNRPIKQISSLVTIDETGKLCAGAALSEIIGNEGFSINQEKLRISQPGSRKVVTGLVVNEKVNVNKKWFADLESKIYAVEKFGWESVAQKENPDDVNAGASAARLLRKIHGKLSFLHMIRGKGDWISADLAYRFNRLHNQKRFRVPSVEIISREQRIPRGIFLVAGYPARQQRFSMPDNQGTGFCVSSGLLVTAAHVIADGTDSRPIRYVYVMNERDQRLEECEVLAFDKHRDIAILKTLSQSIEIERHRFNNSYSVEHGETVITAGYPDYTLGSHASIQQHQIIRRFVSSLVKKAQMNGAAQGGMSGAPVIDENMNVVGLMHKGTLAASGIPEMIEADEIRRVAEDNGLVID